HPEKKSHVANARSDECLLCGSRCTRFLNPKPNEQIRRKPDQFPKNEKEKETVRDDQPKHRAGEKRHIREEAGEILVLGHVADAEDKDAKPNQRDHHQHGGSKRIQNKSEAQRLLTEREPGEILNDAKTGGLQRWHKRQDGQRECKHLANYCERCSTFPLRVRQTQNDERSRERYSRDQPEMIDDPAHAMITSRSISSEFIL